MQQRTTISGLLAGPVLLTVFLAPGFPEASGETREMSAKAGEFTARLAEPQTARKTEQHKRAVPCAEHHIPGGRDRTKVHEVGSAAAEVQLLKDQMALLQQQVEQLRLALEEQQRRLAQVLQSPLAASAEAAKVGRVASLGMVSPNSLGADATLPPAAHASVVASPVPATQSEIQQYTSKVEDLVKKLDGTEKNLGGFKFSGDFRFRLDAQARSGDKNAPPLQNIRSRYRLRVNIDKELDPRFKFHMQLSTGPLNNGLTNDQDFAGTVAKHPFSIAEAYIDFHSNPKFTLRGGRMEEIFADSSRFLWDDDVRFNGFEQFAKLPVNSNPLRIKSVEFRAAEYILTNPNVAILSASSPLVSAGFQPGRKVRDANLFHPGVVLRGDLASGWSHQLISDVQIYRNPDQIQLSSVPSGFPVVVSNALGIALSGPMTGAGNGTTTPGGAIYSAPNFQIVRLDYRLDYKGWRLRGREMPAWLDFQAARNTGTSKLRDAFMASANLGTVKGYGDARFLYQFTIKDANSLISQFTDDDIGIGTGVNIAVHALRFDVGLTRFLQWQNILFIQNVRRPSNPAEQFFVPLQRGANTTFRYLGQLAFTF